MIFSFQYVSFHRFCIVFLLILIFFMRILDLNSIFIIVGWNSMLLRKTEREMDYESTINRVYGVRSAQNYDNDNDNHNSYNNHSYNKNKTNFDDDTCQNDNNMNNSNYKRGRSKVRKVYLYSSQALNFKVLAMNEMRERLGKVKGAVRTSVYTFSLPISSSLYLYDDYILINILVI